MKKIQIPIIFLISLGFHEILWADCNRDFQSIRNFFEKGGKLWCVGGNLGNIKEIEEPETIRNFCVTACKRQALIYGCQWETGNWMFTFRCLGFKSTKNIP